MEDRNKIVEYDNIMYLINEEESIAGVFGYRKGQERYIIPRSIKQGTNEYYVTSILPKAFKNIEIEFVQFASDSVLQTINKKAFLNSEIKHIRIPSSVTSIGENAFRSCRKIEVFEIPDDSKLQTIDKNAFYGSTIDNITIPSELVDLKEDWCNGTRITKIEVSPKNPRYRLYEDKMIIGKTSIEQSNYDCLIFCVRNIKRIKIPNFIEHICSRSFDSCQELESIKFQINSKLQTIDKMAFSESTIKSIRLPSSVTFIGECAFQYCKQHQKIEIPNDSKLQTIDNKAFFFSTIESITIPSNLVDLKEGWCYKALKLSKIGVSPDNPRYRLYEDKMIIGKTSIEQSNYDCLIFCARNIKHIKIPNFIEHICSYSFTDCNELESIEFPNDSKLQIIDKSAFSESTIKSIRIPSSVTIIREFTFAFCHSLQRIEIPNDSKLQTIDDNVFTDSIIKSITIPSSVKLFGENVFSYCAQLQIIEMNNPKLMSKFKFYHLDVIIMIPVYS